MEESQLGGILSRAKGLMAMDEEINKIANNIRKNVSNGLFESVDEFGGIADVDMSSYQPAPERAQQQTPVPNRNSKLPREIVESMTSNPIDTSILDVNRSVLETSGVIPSVPAQKKRNATTINEQVAYNPTPAQQQQVDYSLIKSIVEECVRKYTSAVTKKVIKECKESSGMNELKAMKVGNKFSFITENGDVYEATLKYKRNINEG